jgi:AraC-like DNA-binding protein
MSKRISGAGKWAVRYSDFGDPSFAAVMEGECLLTVDGQKTVHLKAGDFVLLPATPAFTMSGLEPVESRHIDPRATATHEDEVRHGTPDGPPDVRMLGGYFVFDAPDASMLVSQMPPIIHVRGVERLSVLVQLLGDESIAQRPGRDLVLARLVEVLLVEALRLAPNGQTPPGLLRGLADTHLAPAIREMHLGVAETWTMDQLARKSALSRSAFFERFTRIVGVPPMEYLLTWRMAIAKDLLRRQDLGLTEIAERVGYGSASAFSTAFSRQTGMPPRAYAKSGDA